MTRDEFPFRFDPRYRLAALPFGVTPSTSRVVVDDDTLCVIFGPWRLRTPLANIAALAETGGFSFIKTAGSARLSFTDRGVTFATNGDHALCIQFHEPVPGIEPTGRLRHPGATVTVADVPALRARITEKRGASAPELLNR